MADPERKLDHPHECGLIKIYIRYNEINHWYSRYHAGG